MFSPVRPHASRSTSVEQRVAAATQQAGDMLKTAREIRKELQRANAIYQIRKESETLLTEFQLLKSTNGASQTRMTAIQNRAESLASTLNQLSNRTNSPSATDQ
jgi:Mg2+ and Co2+ transporter CorA